MTRLSTQVVRTIRSTCLYTAMIASSISATPMNAAEIEGFTEPYRNIDVAAADAGIMESIHVKEGARVVAGQELGNLDDDVLQATLNIAERTMNAKGKYESAKAELRLRSERLEKLRILLERKHASQEEFDRTDVEKEVAQATVLAVEEDLLIRSLEYKRIEVQIAMRSIRSPIDGVVTKVHKDIGEFVSPNDPNVVTIAQLDPLTAVFSVPSVATDSMNIGDSAKVVVGSKARQVSGTIEYISPVTDAQSGTVQVKITLPNPKNELRSGDRCMIVVDGVIPTEPQTAGAAESRKIK